jgi:hypothetical protein
MNTIARRRLLAGGLAGIGLAAVGLLAYEVPKVLETHYPKTPYDDLIGRLPNRDDAARLGSAVISAEKDFDPQRTARKLRDRLKSISLAAAADADARGSRLLEAGGWVLPYTLAELCALAASASLPKRSSLRAVPTSVVQTSGI